MSFELTLVLILFAIILGMGVFFGIRVIRVGPVHFDRVDQQGGSSLLSKNLMEGAYWVFQPLAKFLIFCRFTPNQISWGSLILGLLAGCCLAFGHFGFGALFAGTSAVFDSLDGIVARSTGRSSEAGEVLDATVDRYVEFFFLGGLTLYYRETPALMVLTLAALVGAFMVSYSTAKGEALQIQPPQGNMRRPERAVYLILGAALSPVTISYLEVNRDYPSPFAHPMLIALCIVAIAGNISAIKRLSFISKRIREQEGERNPRALARGLANL